MSYDSLWHDRNERRLKTIEEQNKEILELLRGLKRGEERIMSQQDDLNATAAQEEQDIASIRASQASFAASAASQVDAIKALQQQIADNPGQPAASLDLSAIQQGATDLHTAAQALASAATTEAGSVTPPGTGGGTPTTPPDNTGGGGTVTPPDNTGGGTTATPDQPVYTYTGQGIPADPAWNPAPFLTAAGDQLYYFASDSTGSAANGNGLGGVWAVYDVSQGVQPASSGGGTGTPTNEPSPPGTTA